MSHDQIQLSALKGEGELKNLELNEEVLTELLELPSWLRLSGATCNRVAVRIQWTKLKSVPVHKKMFFDFTHFKYPRRAEIRNKFFFWKK